MNKHLHVICKNRGNRRENSKTWCFDGVYFSQKGVWCLMFVTKCICHATALRHMFSWRDLHSRKLCTFLSWILFYNLLCASTVNLWQLNSCYSIYMTSRVMRYNGSHMTFTWEKDLDQRFTSEWNERCETFGAFRDFPLVPLFHAHIEMDYFISQWHHVRFSLV